MVVVETEIKTIQDPPGIDSKNNNNDCNHHNASSGVTFCTYKGDVKKGTTIKHGFGTLNTTPFKIKYIGEWQDGLKHGQGTQTWSSGSTYKGKWKNDKRHGQGSYAYADGNIYEGEWVDGLKQGWGMFTWSSSGSTYKGQWMNDLRQGQGLFEYANGRKYDGGWVKNKKHGKGIVTNEDGSTYIGYYKNGKKVLQKQQQQHQQQKNQPMKKNEDIPVNHHGDEKEFVGKYSKIVAEAKTKPTMQDDLDYGKNAKIKAKQDPPGESTGSPIIQTKIKTIRDSSNKGTITGSPTIQTEIRPIQDPPDKGTGNPIAQTVIKPVQDPPVRSKSTNSIVQTVMKPMQSPPDRGTKNPKIQTKIRPIRDPPERGTSLNSIIEETEIKTIQDPPDIDSTNINNETSNSNNNGITTSSYKGDFKKGTTIKHGFGTLNTIPFKIKYIGEWQDNLKHGQGTQTWSSGSKYRGGWKGDKRHGRGIYLYADGNIYEGEWVDGLKQGWGMFTWSSGSSYQGQWMSDLRHGQGVLTYADGSTYDGGWVKNKKHGKSIITNKDGGTHIGYYMNGKKVLQKEQPVRLYAESLNGRKNSPNEKKNSPVIVKINPGKTSITRPFQQIIYINDEEKVLYESNPPDRTKLQSPNKFMQLTNDYKRITFEDDLGDEEDQAFLPPTNGGKEESILTSGDVGKLSIEANSQGQKIENEGGEKEKLHTRPSVASELGSEVDTGKKYDVFLTHNWGKDTQKRDNHKRVVAFNKELTKNGIKNTWLDEEQMTGNVELQMSEGIDNSRFVIVFLTKEYIKKTSGKTGMKDNCKLEFNYITQKKATDEILVVVMEEACSTPTKWKGPVGLHLAGELYYSYMKDSELKSCAKDVAKELKKRMTPLNLRESLAFHAERVRLLNIRSPHLPGYSCCDDWIQWNRNNHPLFGLCFHFRENPITMLKRIMVLIGSLAFGIFISNVVFFSIHLIKNGNKSSKGEEEFVDFQSYVYQYMVVLCTLGALVHSLIDLVMLRLTACLSCGTFAWCFSICLSLLFTILAVVTTIQAVAPEATMMLNDQIMNKALTAENVLTAYFVEFAAVYFVFFPLVFSTIFIGTFRPCIRFRLERERAVQTQKGSERVFGYNSDDLPFTYR